MGICCFRSGNQGITATAQGLGPNHWNGRRSNDRRGTETLEDALQVIRDSSNATVVLKRGEKGCEVFEPGNQQSRTARPFQSKF